MLAKSMGYKSKQAFTYSRTRHHLRHLGQVDLVVILLVAETVLVPVRELVCMTDRHAFQFLNGTIPCHFEIDAKAAVEWACGKM